MLGGCSDVAAVGLDEFAALGGWELEPIKASTGCLVGSADEAPFVLFMRQDRVSGQGLPIESLVMEDGDWIEDLVDDVPDALPVRPVASVIPF